MSKHSRSNKKIIVYAVIGIVAVAALAVSTLTKQNAPPGGEISGQNSTAIHTATFCGVPSPNSNTYIQEVKLTGSCEMPLGIYAQNHTVWYISTADGILGKYDDVQHQFTDKYAIPGWRTGPSSVGNPEMAWDVKADNHGAIWFVSEANKIFRFDTHSKQFYEFATPPIYPSSFEFDPSGNVYLSGFFGDSLWYGDISKMKNGTSDGFSEIKLPLDQFNGTTNKVGSGSLSIDSAREAVWLPLLSFEEKGVIFRYDIATKQIKAYPLSTSPPAPLLSPSSSALDGSGNLWVADHATSMFFKLDPNSGNVTKFVTSVASPRIFGGKDVPNAYTLPYWIKKDARGVLWFNEHTGNKIARFDPVNETLVEYWIPSQNPYWANCSGNQSSCGLANAMQFSPVDKGSVWFSEWTEDKIGKVNASEPVPIAVSLATNSFSVARGQSVGINVDLTTSQGFTGKMIASGTLSRTGDLINATGTFSQDTISLSAAAQKQVSFIFTPSTSLPAGEYTLMLGAENDQVSFLKAVHVTVS